MLKISGWSGVCFISYHSLNPVVEEAGGEGGEMAAGVGCGEVAVDDVGVVAVVEIGADTVDISACYELLGHFLFSLAVCSGE